MGFRQMLSLQGNNTAISVDNRQIIGFLSANDPLRGNSSSYPQVVDRGHNSWCYIEKLSPPPTHTPGVRAALAVVKQYGPANSTLTPAQGAAGGGAVLQKFRLGMATAKQQCIGQTHSTYQHQALSPRTEVSGPAEGFTTVRTVRRPVGRGAGFQ